MKTCCSFGVWAEATCKCLQSTHLRYLADELPQLVLLSKQHLPQYSLSIQQMEKVGSTVVRGASVSSFTPAC